MAEATFDASFAEGEIGESGAWIGEDLDYPLGRLGAIDLYREVHRLMGQRNRLDYRLLCLLRELDTRETVDGRPFYIAAWFSRTFGVGYGAAREKVRAARALGGLPLIDAAFRDGELSYSKVRALTRVATAENESKLLALVRYESADRIEHLVRQYKARERMDDVQELFRQRSLTYAWDQDGSLVVKARLTPEQGMIWIQALKKAESVGDSEEQFPARQADALTAALEESLNDRPRRSQTGDHYQVVVHVSAETLAEHETGEGGLKEGSELSADDDRFEGGSGIDEGRGEPPVIEHGPSIHPETVRRLSCDGSLVPILTDEAGGVLNVGRKTRVIPPAMRRALLARDKTCRFPGCSHSRYVDGHHIVHWARGGETRLSNLVLLCRRHHRLVHEFGYRVHNGENGFEFVPPS